MPVIVEWSSVERPATVVRQMARAARAGRIVGIRQGDRLIATASARSKAALARLANGSAFLTLAARDVVAAADWLPRLTGVGERLASRCWPGRLLLTAGSDLGVEVGRLGRTPPAVRPLLFRDGRLAVGSPHPDPLRRLLRHCDEPLAYRSFSPDQIDCDLLVVESDCGTGGRDTFEESVVHLERDVWRLEREGAIPADLIRRLACRWVVFACTGNTCRSPMAEALCKKLLADRLGCAVDALPDHGYLVMSAGVAAIPGCEASPQALDVVRSLGGDLSRHVSRSLGRDLALLADHLVVMTRSHLQIVRQRFPQRHRPVRLLARSGEDVSDPYGADRDVYLECARQILRHLDDLLPEVLAS
jgi:protein-tyrosine phosphatase